MPADADGELMRRVKRGEATALAELVDRYQQPVINFVGRTLQDFTEAEDVAQNVFVQVFKSAHRYQETAKFTTWLFTIARNLCLNELRRRARHPTEPMDATPAGAEDGPVRQFADRAATGPTEALLRGELERKVEEAIADLPENQRTALLLCREEELSYEAIAEVLGCSLSATKSLIHRARETLKARLKPYLQTGAWGDPDES
jgi:RNA polymerase sigma-70 factor (ECF subfamily)